MPQTVWRHFLMRDVTEALAWASSGNVSVHNTGIPYRRWTHTAHLFAVDEAALRQAARTVGCNLKWIQHKPARAAGLLEGYYLTHYDLFGAPLVRALGLCENHP